jgi:hypothetical protein
VPAGDPSAKVAELLAARQAGLPERAKTMLAVRSETAAKQAFARGSRESIGRASRLCALNAALGSGGGASCAAVAALEQGAAPSAQP